MAGFDDQLSAVLGNPELMGKILSMAESLNQQNPPAAQTPPPAAPEVPFSPEALQTMVSLLGKTRIDSRQQGLLQALRGFLPEDRISRLEKAMQAAKIAGCAASALKQNTGPGR